MSTPAQLWLAEMPDEVSGTPVQTWLAEMPDTPSASATPAQTWLADLRWTQVGIADTNDTTFLDTVGLVPGTTYTYDLGGLQATVLYESEVLVGDRANSIFFGSNF